MLDLIVPEDPPRSTTGRAQDARWAEYVAALATDVRPFDAQWTEYRRIYRNRPEGDGPPLAWMPSPSVIAAANITALQQDLGARSYPRLYQWSVEHLPDYIGQSVLRDRHPRSLR